MTDADSLERVKLIAGKTREIQGKHYLEDTTDAHERIDALLLDLLKDTHPETVEFVKGLKLWYG
jgi:hypothetical protein